MITPVIWHQTSDLCSSECSCMLVDVNHRCARSGCGQGCTGSVVSGGSMTSWNSFTIPSLNGARRLHPGLPCVATALLHRREGPVCFNRAICRRIYLIISKRTSTSVISVNAGFLWPHCHSMLPFAAIQLYRKSQRLI